MEKNAGFRRNVKQEFIEMDKKLTIGQFPKLPEFVKMEVVANGVQ